MEARMQFERANLEIDGPVGILRMNDPDVLNALSPGMVKGMTKRSTPLPLRRHQCDALC
jgi:enoyl-CoA hydratase/carnithine racemase